MGINPTVENKQIDLDELLQFCKEVSEGLIRKSNKSNSVNITVVKNTVEKTIFSDEWKIKQVILNLLSNAIKFTMNGDITLEVSKVEGLDNDTLVIKVKDQGIGMKNEIKEKLFKPFSKGDFQKNDLGSGLGLFIVKEIATKLNGSLNFNSEYLKGTEFTINLPIKKLNFISNVDITEREINIIKEKSIDNSNCSNTTIINNINPILIQKYKDGLYYENSNSSINKSSSDESSHIYLKPPINNAVFFDYGNMNFCSFTLKEIFINDLFQNVSRFKSKDILNIIVTDDEVLIRKSEIRILQTISEELNLKINVFELEDGVETIYFVSECILKGITIDVIMSDESMKFVKGSQSFQITNDLMDNKNLRRIPFYLITAFQGDYFKIFGLNVSNIISKPLNRQIARSILNEAIR